MSFKSEAQRRKFYALKAEGKMDQKTIDEWEKDTPKNLPDKLPKEEKKKTAASVPVQKVINKYAYKLGADAALRILK